MPDYHVSTAGDNYTHHGLRHVKEDTHRKANRDDFYYFLLYNFPCIPSLKKTTDTQNCEAVCVSKTLSFRRTDIWSLTYSLTWLDLEPNSPATTSSSASRSVAARTFCRSCCCSSFVENAKSSSSMPASLVITCRGEPSGFLSLGPIPPSPRLKWSGRLPAQAQRRSCLVTERSFLAVQSQPQERLNKELI